MKMIEFIYTIIFNKLHKIHMGNLKSIYQLHPILVKGYRHAVGNFVPSHKEPLVENLIRPFALGRKNWMMSGSPRGAHASALFYSLIATAKANGLNPFDYLKILFEHIRSCRTAQDYTQDPSKCYFWSLAFMPQESFKDSQQGLLLLAFKRFLEQKNQVAQNIAF